MKKIVLGSLMMLATVHAQEIDRPFIKELELYAGGSSSAEAVVGAFTALKKNNQPLVTASHASACAAVFRHNSSHAQQLLEKIAAAATSAELLQLSCMLMTPASMDIVKEKMDQEKITASPDFYGETIKPLLALPAEAVLPPAAATQLFIGNTQITSVYELIIQWAYRTERPYQPPYQWNLVPAVLKAVAQEYITKDPRSVSIAAVADLHLSDSKYTPGSVSPEVQQAYYRSLNLEQQFVSPLIIMTDLLKETRAYGVMSSIVAQLPERLSSVVVLPHSAIVEAVAWAADGVTLASGSNDGVLTIWNAELARTSQGKEGKLNTINAHAEKIYSVAFSPDGKKVASASKDKTIRVWNVETGEKVAEMVGHSFYIYSVAFSPDGKQIASASRDKTVRIWDAQSGAQLKRLDGHTSNVTGVAWSDDGSKLASSSWDKTVRVWDAQTGALIKELVGATGAVNNVTWYPNNDQIVSGSIDASLYQWRVSTGALEITVPAAQGSIFSVALSPAGQMGAFVDANNQSRLSVVDGKTLQTLRNYDDLNSVIYTVSWGSRGSYIAAAGENKTVTLLGPVAPENKNSLDVNIIGMSTILYILSNKINVDQTMKESSPLSQLITNYVPVAAQLKLKNMSK